MILNLRAIAGEFVVVVYCQVQFGALCGFISSETLLKHRKEMICLEQFSPPGI